MGILYRRPPIGLSPKGDYLKQDVKLAYYRWRNVLWPRSTKGNTESAAVGGKVEEVETVKIQGATQAEIDRLKAQRKRLQNHNKRIDRSLSDPNSGLTDKQKQDLKGIRDRNQAESNKLDAQLKLAQGGRAV